MTRRQARIMAYAATAELLRLALAGYEDPALPEVRRELDALAENLQRRAARMAWMEEREGKVKDESASMPGDGLHNGGEPG